MVSAWDRFQETAIRASARIERIGPNFGPLSKITRVMVHPEHYKDLVISAPESAFNQCELTVLGIPVVADTRVAGDMVEFSLGVPAWR